MRDRTPDSAPRQMLIRMGAYDNHALASDHDLHLTSFVAETRVGHMETSVLLCPSCCSSHHTTTSRSISRCMLRSPAVTERYRHGVATATVWIRHARYSKDGAANYKRPVSMAGGTSPLNAPEETMCYVFLASLTSLPRSARQCGRTYRAPGLPACI